MRLLWASEKRWLGDCISMGKIDHQWWTPSVRLMHSAHAQCLPWHWPWPFLKFKATISLLHGHTDVLHLFQRPFLYSRSVPYALSFSERTVWDLQPFLQVRISGPWIPFIHFELSLLLHAVFLNRTVPGKGKLPAGIASPWKGHSI